MSNKLDTEKKLFLGPNAVREVTVFGAIRKAVHELNSGDGVAYEDLEKHVLENFKPAKSGNYGPSYVKAYVRDAVNKYGYLSHEDLGVAYETIAPAEKKTSEEKPRKLTKAQIAKNDLLRFVQTRGEINSVDEINESQVDIAAIVQETKKKTKTVEKMVEELKSEGLVRTGQVGESTYVYLTEAGWSHLNGSSSEESETREEEPVEA